LVSEKLINADLIEKQKIKYSPPESFLYGLDDLSHDIWSFGCLLIDIFSKERQIFKFNLSREDLAKSLDLNLFPEIPSDLNGVLRDIVAKCLERNYQERIKIQELSNNLNVVLDNLTNSKNYLS
jgi:serine/threonine protein kinase